MRPLISATGLTRKYTRGNQIVSALDGVSFQMAEGEFVAVVGPSGSGKSTLLNLLGCMDSPSSGSLLIAEQDISSASERAKTEFRRKYVGFVFQHFGLLPTLNVSENIRLPHVFTKSQEHHDVDQLLSQLQLAHRSHHRPSELSGGEMQRVAIARALYNKPKLLLADEPTGNLDTKAAQSILELFKELNQQGLSIILVTHNMELAAATQRVIRLSDGRIVSDSRPADSSGPVRG